MFRRAIGVICLGVATLFTVSDQTAHAVVVAQFDAAQFNSNGFQFGDFDDFDTIDPTGGFIAINATDPLIDGDNSNGIFGGIGSDIAANFNAASSQLEVTLRVNAANSASDFRVVLLDDDGLNETQQLTGDEFQFFFDLTSVVPGEFVTLVQPLLNPGPVFMQPAFNREAGDEVQNYGLYQIQVQSAFGGTEPLVIDVESVKINDTDNPVLIEMTTATFEAQPQTFTFDTYSEEGVVDRSGDTFIINADPAGPGGPNGGIGFNGLNIDFEATDFQLEIEAKLLPSNTADGFNIVLGDEDGDDSGPMMGSEDYNFNIATANFDMDDFSVFTLPLGSGSETDFVTTFGFTNGGDGLQNFGLSQMQIQSLGTDPGVLNIEIARVSIVERPEGLAGDYNGDNVVDAADYVAWRDNLGADESVLAGPGDDSGVVDEGDFDVWVTSFGNSNLSATLGNVAAVPEPAAAPLCLLIGTLGLVAGGRLQRNAMY